MSSGSRDGRRGGGVHIPFQIYHTSIPEDYVVVFPGGRSGETAQGGRAQRYINNSGDPSVKGTVVSAGSAGDGFVKATPAGGQHPIGVIYENGIANGDWVWVVTYGRCQVLLEDGTASTAGYWAQTSNVTTGRANITTASPPGGGIPELDAHMEEIGHCTDSQTAGTDVLAFITLHFN